MITSQGEGAKQLMHVRWRHQKTNTASVAAVLRWWVAVDAPADSDEQHVRSVDHLAVFRTQENALLPGWHEWEWNDMAGRGGADWVAPGDWSFETTLL